MIDKEYINEYEKLIKDNNTVYDTIPLIYKEVKNL